MMNNGIFLADKKSILFEMSKILDFEELGQSQFPKDYFRLCFDMTLISMNIDISSLVRRIEKIYNNILSDFSIYFIDHDVEC